MLVIKIIDTWEAGSRDINSSGSLMVFIRFRNKQISLFLLSSLPDESEPNQFLSPWCLCYSRKENKKKISSLKYSLQSFLWLLLPRKPIQIPVRKHPELLQPVRLQPAIREGNKDGKQTGQHGYKAHWGERERNKLKDKASASEEYLSFRSNQGFSISVYCSSSGGTRYFRQMGERIGLLFQLLSWWCYESSVFCKTIY